MRGMRRAAMSALGVALLAAPTAPASAFTFWQVHEVFSNDDGSVQFIEFLETQGVNGQRNFDGKLLQTFGPGSPGPELLEFLLFDQDLPSNQTANRHALVATAGFAALDGAVVPDFVMPDGFLDPDAVVEIRLSTIDTFSFSQGAIPTDGVHSLYRTGPPTRPNSPTNFAGDSGSIDVPEPAGPALLAACAGALASLRRRRRAG